MSQEKPPYFLEQLQVEHALDYTLLICFNEFVSQNSAEEKSNSNSEKEKRKKYTEFATAFLNHHRLSKTYIDFIADLLEVAEGVYSDSYINEEGVFDDFFLYYKDTLIRFSKQQSGYYTGNNKNISLQGISLSEKCKKEHTRRFNQMIRLAFTLYDNFIYNSLSELKSYDACGFVNSFDKAHTLLQKRLRQKEKPEELRIQERKKREERRQLKKRILLDQQNKLIETLNALGLKERIQKYIQFKLDGGDKRFEKCYVQTCHAFLTENERMLLLPFKKNLLNLYIVPPLEGCTCVIPVNLISYKDQASQATVSREPSRAAIGAETEKFALQVLLKLKEIYRGRVVIHVPIPHSVLDIHFQTDYLIQYRGRYNDGKHETNIVGMDVKTSISGAKKRLQDDSNKVRKNFSFYQSFWFQPYRVTQNTQSDTEAINIEVLLSIRILCEYLQFDMKPFYEYLLTNLDTLSKPFQTIEYVN